MHVNKIYILNKAICMCELSWIIYVYIKNYSLENVTVIRENMTYLRGYKQYTFCTVGQDCVMQIDLFITMDYLLIWQFLLPVCE